MMEYSFFFFPFFFFGPSLLIYFVVGSFGLGLMFTCLLVTCLHVRGTFYVAVTDITDSKQQQQRERKKRGK